MTYWVPTIRTVRLEHNHIHQGEYDDCPACAEIDPWHQTFRYLKSILAG